MDRVDATDNERSDDDESVGRVAEFGTETVRQTGHKTWSGKAGKCKVVNLTIQAVDEGQHMQKVEFRPLVDSGVYRTLVSEGGHEKEKQDASNQEM